MNELYISLTNLLHLENNPGSSIKSVEQNFKEILNGQRELHEKTINQYLETKNKGFSEHLKSEV